MTARSLDDLDKLVADVASLKKDMLARKTARFFRDVVGNFMTLVASKVGCDVVVLTRGNVNCHLLPGMTTDDFRVLQKLYRYYGCRGITCPLDAAKYAALEKHLNEHATIPAELEVGIFTDVKPLLESVIEWSRGPLADRR